MHTEITDNKLGIKSWDEADRPREKLLSKGIFSLSDAELIAILIGSGNRTETAVDLSKRILAGVQNNLHLLGKASVVDLQKYKGIGEAKAISIVAAMELGRRRKTSDKVQRQIIRASKDAFDIFQPLLADLPHEEFWVLLLNNRNQVMDKIRISTGSTTATIVDPKMILKPAIEKLASSIVLCHNHPSGNLEPSKEDINITKKTHHACKLLDIRLLDHIIIADDVFFSFTDSAINLD